MINTFERKLAVLVMNYNAFYVAVEELTLACKDRDLIDIRIELLDDLKHSKDTMNKLEQMIINLMGEQ